MELEKILLVLNSGAPSAAQVGVTMTLAQAHAAEVEGLYLAAEPVLPFDDDFAIGPAAVGAVLAERDHLVHKAMAESRALFERAAHEKAVRTSWTAAAASASRIPAALARAADLVVIRNPGPADPDGRMFVAGVVLGAGTPCLIVPDEAKSDAVFDRIVVAWNGSREAKRAVDDALPLLRSASAVRVLSLGEPRNAEEPTAADVRHHLARHGIAAEESHRECCHGAGEALLADCQEFQAQLLVMGAYGRSRFSEALLGGVTFTALTHARIPLLLSH